MLSGSLQSKNQNKLKAIWAKTVKPAPHDIRDILTTADRDLRYTISNSHSDYCHSGNSAARYCAAGDAKSWSRCQS